jgi:hypothetical protein
MVTCAAPPVVTSGAAAEATAGTIMTRPVAAIAASALVRGFARMPVLLGFPPFERVDHPLGENPGLQARLRRPRG